MKKEEAYEFIKRLKKKFITESAAHTLLTLIGVDYLIDININPLIAVGIGIMINVIGEVVLPKFDKYDIFYGSLGAVVALGLYYSTLLFI